MSNTENTAAENVKDALNGLYLGDMPERDIIQRLASALGQLGCTWSPPPRAALGDDGGYVPADDDQPKQLADFINARLTGLRYYDGETALGGPYLLTPFRPWYDAVIYSPCGSEAQAAHANMLLQWAHQSGIVVSDLLPPYPGKAIGWRWENVQLGSQWIVKVWLTNGAVAVQAQ